MLSTGRRPGSWTLATFLDRSYDMVSLRWVLSVTLLAVLLPAAGSGAPLASPDPAAVDAQRLADFFWWMAVAAAVVWFAALGLLGYCLRTRPRPATAPAPRRVVVADAGLSDARGPVGRVLAN